MEAWSPDLRLKSAAAGMPEEISPPVKPIESGSRAARGLKSGPPIDQNSKTLPSFKPVVPDPPPVAPPNDTHLAAGDATFQLLPMEDLSAQATIEQRAPAAAGNIEPTLTVTASETQGVAGPTDVTMAARPDGVT